MFPFCCYLLLTVNVYIKKNVLQTKTTHKNENNNKQKGKVEYPYVKSIFSHEKSSHYECYKYYEEDKNREGQKITGKKQSCTLKTEKLENNTNHSQKSDIKKPKKQKKSEYYQIEANFCKYHEAIAK